LSGPGIKKKIQFLQKANWVLETKRRARYLGQRRALEMKTVIGRNLMQFITVPIVQRRRE
jgi:hypothetical protein